MAIGYGNLKMAIKTTMCVCVRAMKQSLRQFLLSSVNILKLFLLIYFGKFLPERIACRKITASAHGMDTIPRCTH